MKIIIWLLWFCLVTHICQSKIRICSSVGVGVSNFIEKGKLPYLNQVPSYKASVGIETQRRKYLFSLELSYSTTGFIAPLSLFYVYNSKGELTIHAGGEYETRFQHLSLPLSAGYHKSLSKRFSLIPMVELVMAYNAGVKDKINSSVPNQSHNWHSMSTEQFNMKYNKFGAFTGCKIKLLYKTNRINWFIGPSYDVQITSFCKDPEYLWNVKNGYQFLLTMGAIF